MVWVRVLVVGVLGRGVRVLVGGGLVVGVGKELALARGLVVGFGGFGVHGGGVGRFGVPGQPRLAGAASMAGRPAAGPATLHPKTRPPWPPPCVPLLEEPRAGP